MPLGEPLPGAELRAQAALAPILASARAAAIRVSSLEDARQLDRKLREEWPLERIEAMLRPIAYAIRAHVSSQWGRASAGLRLDAAEDAWTKRAAQSVRRLFGSLRRGATQAIRAAQSAGESITATVAQWSEALPTRHGSLEERLAEEIGSRVHKVSQQWHRQRARGVKARWRWRTQRDERVRRKHRDLEGQEFAHNEQPSEGWPGEPYGCRCWAEWLV
jgi:SPP1 gp7 family putative phage head morphogenesis protein